MQEEWTGEVEAYIREYSADEYESDRLKEEKIQGVPITIDRSDAKRMTRHLSFLGVMNIVSGIILCFLIVGIPMGILQIIAGNKAKSISRVIRYKIEGMDTGKPYVFGDEMYDYFKKTGIMMITGIALCVFGYIINAVIVLAIFTFAV